MFLRMVITLLLFSSGKDGNLIPQIVMNPWDPNQTPVMTLAPLANAMQAYQQQWLMQQQAGGQTTEGNSNSGTNTVQPNATRQPDGQQPTNNHGVEILEEKTVSRGNTGNRRGHQVTFREKSSRV